MMKRCIFWILLLNCGGVVYSQQTLQVLHYVVEGTDTIPIYDLPTFTVTTKNFSSKRAAKRYNRLVKNVIKVYPYAKIAGAKLKKYAPILDTLTSKSRQREYMEIIEYELLQEYGKEMMDLTFTQGRILLKLIDRETSKNTYSIIREFRGRLRAFFYQGVASIWDYDLKMQYDPEGEDRSIEEIVQQIESGKLK
ncbi:MAG: DUF4294 domain-containing protein [Bacteroidales bacterium]|nr:DUF4294 domain-containing protein [Bacteroidales bacterium]